MKKWLLIFMMMVSPAFAGTLENVKQRGEMSCGISTGLPGFAMPDKNGYWNGLDVDLCRALVAAIFNDPNKVKLIPLHSKDKLLALQSGEIDVLINTTTWTMARETTMGLEFPVINYYDGQGFMVRKSSKINSTKELNGASICVRQGTTTELNLGDYFRSNKMQLKVVTFGSSDEALSAYDANRCDAITTDASGLYGDRLRLKAPDDHAVLPEVISKEPLAPGVRKGDEKWLDIVKWTHYAMLTAEELGVTKANVDQMIKSDNPEIKRLLGVDGKFGESLGLTNDWVVRIVKSVGNYGEAFENSVGMKSPLKLTRGYNALWSSGGLQYAPPIR